MSSGWEGTRVLVTGASSGIGAALAREMAAHGAVVGLCARRTALLEEVLADCRRTSPGSRAWTVDLAALDGLEAFVHRVEDELGGIDVLVNNAGIMLDQAAVDTPWQDLVRITETDYYSPVRLTRAALPGMVARGGGHVVVVSSMAARMSTPGEAAYAAAKAALSAYFEALAGELWDSTVRVHLVYPALIDVTPGADGDDDLAATATGATRIPAAVLARDIRRQMERDELELYMPYSMRQAVAERATDTAKSVAFMAGWFQRGRPL
jgi:short-subunit dehydrogenase